MPANNYSEVVVHVAADIPHYWPIYLALNRLKNGRKGIIQVHDHIQGSTRMLFEEVFKTVGEHATDNKNILHLIVAGQIEKIYDEDGFSAINYFASASILMHRNPIWIFADKNQDTAIKIKLIQGRAGSITNAQLPPLGSTLLAAFDHEMTVQNTTNYKVGEYATFFTNCNTERSTAFKYKLENDDLPKACPLFVSIFPKISGELADTYSLLNLRLPTKHNGFSAVWTPLAYMDDEDATKAWVEFTDLMQAAVVQLYNFDNETFVDDTTQIKYIGKIQSNLVKNFNSIQFNRIGWANDATGVQPWESAATELLAHFIVNRLWDYNFMHAHRDGNPDAPDLLYPRSYTAQLREVYGRRFRGKFEPMVKRISDLRPQILELNNLISEMTHSLQGCFSDLTEAEMGLNLLQSKLGQCFPKATHTVSQCLETTGELTQAAAKSLFDVISPIKTLLNNKKAANGPRDKQLQAMNDYLTTKGGARQKKLSDLLAATSASDFTNILTGDTKVLFGSLDSVPLLLLELKALSRSGVPSSWLTDAVSHTSTVIPFRQILGRSVEYKPKTFVTPLQGLSFCELFKALKDNREVTIASEAKPNWAAITIHLQSGPSLKPLIGLLYGQSNASFGKTGEQLMLLKQWGFDLQVNEFDKACPQIRLAIDISMVNGNL